MIPEKANETWDIMERADGTAHVACRLSARQPNS
jgi:hypothetical protein